MGVQPPHFRITIHGTTWFIIRFWNNYCPQLWNSPTTPIQVLRSAPCFLMHPSSITIYPCTLTGSHLKRHQTLYKQLLATIFLLYHLCSLTNLTNPLSRFAIFTTHFNPTIPVQFYSKPDPKNLILLNKISWADNLTKRVAHKTTTNASNHLKMAPCIKLLP